MDVNEIRAMLADLNLEIAKEAMKWKEACKSPVWGWANLQQVYPFLSPVIRGYQVLSEQGSNLPEGVTKEVFQKEMEDIESKLGLLGFKLNMDTDYFTNKTKKLVGDSIHAEDFFVKLSTEKYGINDKEQKDENSLGISALDLSKAQKYGKKLLKTSTFNLDEIDKFAMKGLDDKSYTGVATAKSSILDYSKKVKKCYEDSNPVDKLAFEAVAKAFWFNPENEEAKEIYKAMEKEQRMKEKVSRLFNQKVPYQYAK